MTYATWEEAVGSLLREPSQREALLQAHGEIFDVNWWQELQVRNRAGDFVDVPPYPEWTRLDANTCRT